ncbi:MAG TPA: branched-chain amino acid ABC transporter permease, partial [Desulfobacterales bacterium]|nr:branched-chain amino acid ABC transporter permease [Desulfobacterales bacterium]
YYLHVSTQAILYIVLALGLNMILSCGLLNLGYIAFFAIGAYTYAILNTKVGFSLWATLPVALALSVISGTILAFVSLKSRSDYFVLVTLAFGEIVRLLLRNADSLTNGPQGIMGIDRPSLFFAIRTPLHFYYLALVWLVIAFTVIHRVTISRLGASWTAVRGNETWSYSAGYHVLAIRISACVLGAVLAGLSGVFFAAWQTFVSPESFSLFESIIVLCMVVLGGGINGNLLGVLLGAIILALLPELFREVQQYRMLAFGAGMTLIVICRSSGIVGRSWLIAADKKLFAAKIKARPGCDHHSQ